MPLGKRMRRVASMSRRPTMSKKPVSLRGIDRPIRKKGKRVKKFIRNVHSKKTKTGEFLFTGRTLIRKSQRKKRRVRFI